MRYSVFGGVLATPFPVPDLPEAPENGAATWSLSVTGEAPDVTTGSLLGTDLVYGSVMVRAYGHGDGVRLIYDDTGTFDVSRDGTRIHWHRPQAGGNLEEAGMADVLGRVLAISLHLTGAVTLHASSLRMPDGRGVALMAPKGFGKSTLAAALVAGGARLLSDDAVPVTPLSTGGCSMSPGVAQLRLWGDSAARVGAPAPSVEGRKVVLSSFEHARVSHESVEMAGAYLLRPVVPRPERPAVTREQMGEIGATLVLVEHAKVGALLGGDHGAVLFTRAADIARRVPVYALHVARDLARLDEAAQGVLDWHR